MKVLILQNSILHYRIPIYNLLSDACNLTVSYSIKLENEDQCNFNIIYLPVKRLLGGLYWHQCNIRKISEEYDVTIVLGDMHWLKFMKLIFFNNSKIIVWGMEASTAKGYKIVNKFILLRLLFMSKADALLHYSDYPIRQYVKMGIPRNKQFVAFNTVKVSNQNLDKERNIILFIGSIHPRKGLDILLKAYKLVNEDIELPELYIVGSGPDSNKLIDWVVNNGLEKKVKMCGAVYDINKKSRIFSKTIACISPCQAGLTVLESMGYGVPFVTSRNAITSGELFNIKNGENGVLMDSLSDLEMILKDINMHPEKYLEMGKRAKHYYDTFRTPINMVNGFVEAINYAINK